LEVFEVLAVKTSLTTKDDRDDAAVFGGIGARHDTGSLRVRAPWKRMAAD
jgi:hypothetical protein